MLDIKSMRSTTETGLIQNKSSYLGKPPSNFMAAPNRHGIFFVQFRVILKIKSRFYTVIDIKVATFDFFFCVTVKTVLEDCMFLFWHRITMTNMAVNSKKSAVKQQK